MCQNLISRKLNGRKDASKIVLLIATEEDLWVNFQIDRTILNGINLNFIILNKKNTFPHKKINRISWFVVHCFLFYFS